MDSSDEPSKTQLGNRNVEVTIVGHKNVSKSDYVPDESTESHPGDHNAEKTTLSQENGTSDYAHKESSESHPGHYNLIAAVVSRENVSKANHAHEDSLKSQPGENSLEVTTIGHEDVSKVNHIPEDLPKSQPGENSLEVTIIGHEDVSKANHAPEDLPKSQPGENSLEVTIIGHEDVSKANVAPEDLPKSRPGENSLEVTTIGHEDVSKMNHAPEDSPRSQPGEISLQVTIIGHEDVRKLAFETNESSKTQPNDQNLEAVVISHRNASKPACATENIRGIQPVECNIEATTVRPKNSIRSACSQITATLIHNWLLIDIGFELAMPTLVLGALHKNSGEKLCMNDDQASWFGSMPHFFHPLGGLISGYLQEQFGRKGSLTLVNIPIFAAWLTLYFADSINTLYVVSVTLGLCCGFTEAPLQSFIGEVGEPRLRGTLSTLSTSFVSLGFLLTYLLGYLVDWRTAALIACSIPVIAFACMTQIPESPTWLIRKNRLKDAQKSLSWLRGWVKPVDVHKEFQDLVEYTKSSGKRSGVESHETGDSSANRHDGYLKTKLREITNKKFLRPLRLVFITFVFQNVTTLLPLKSYLVGILREFEFPVNSMLILTVSSLSFFVGGMLNMVFLRRCGKRKMALFSHGLATASILLIGVYCSFLNGSKWFPGVVWIPMILFINVDFCCGLCVGVLPWQLVSEVYPVTGRGFASGLSAAWAYVITFILSKLYLYLEAWVKLSGVMYLYGSIAFLGVLFHYFYLPETEGKSLAQIETYFTKNHDPKEKFSIGKTQEWTDHGKLNSDSNLTVSSEVSNGVPNPVA